MKIVYNLMSVPDRSPDYTAQQLDRPVHICLDMSRSNKLPRNSPRRYWGVRANFIKAVTPKQGSDYCVVLHDDMDLAPRFADHVERVLEVADGRAVSFYVNGQKKHRDNFAQGIHAYATATEFWPPSLAIPSWMGMEFGEWLETETDCHIAEDEKFKEWLTMTGNTLVQVYPGMSEHAGYDRSTQGNPASVGKNIRKSGLYRPDYDFDAIDWKTQFSKL